MAHQENATIGRAEVPKSGKDTGALVGGYAPSLTPPADVRHPPWDFYCRDHLQGSLESGFGET